MENKPIKRSTHIQDLSRDHHFGLLFCWKIKEGLKKEIEPSRLIAYLNFFWNGHLKGHFEEESILFLNKSENTLCKKAASEHQAIAEQIDEINTHESRAYELFARLIEDIKEHIRFEERTLFPFLEEFLPEERLEAIGKYLEETHEIPFKDDYPDEFWLKGAQ